MWKQMNEERENERMQAEERIRLLDSEKEKLELALEREIEEREKLDFIERQRQY